MSRRDESKQIQCLKRKYEKKERGNNRAADKTA